MSTVKDKPLPTLLKRTSGGGTQMWRTWVERDGDVGVLCVEYGLVDGKKQVTREPITQGKNAGRSNATTPYDQAVAESLGPLGEAEGPQGLRPDGRGVRGEAGPEPDAGPVLQQAPGKVDWTTAFAQPKLDGFRCLARRVGGGLRAFSRENKPIAVPTS
jgi:hypothetical protein